MESSFLHPPLLPPGFRFHPTDEELLVHYLQNRAISAPLPVTIIAELNLYNFDPWELPEKANFGENEWYFFSPRHRKYPNGARPNRAATSGYWKATGTDKPVLNRNGTHKLGVKKALVFYAGKPPKGVKTSWIMHEYRLADSAAAAAAAAADKKASLRLDDWVLCRIYKKPAQARDRTSADPPAGYLAPAMLQLRDEQRLAGAALGGADDGFLEALFASEDSQSPADGAAGMKSAAGGGGTASLYRQPFALTDINWSA